MNERVSIQNLNADQLLDLLLELEVLKEKAEAALLVQLETKSAG